MRQYAMCPAALRPDCCSEPSRLVLAESLASSAIGGTAQPRFGRDRFSPVAASGRLRRFAHVCLPALELFTLHGKHSAVAASLKDTRMAAAGMAIDWLASVAAVAEAETRSFSLRSMEGSMRARNETMRMEEPASLSPKDEWMERKSERRALDTAAREKTQKAPRDVRREGRLQAC